MFPAVSTGEFSCDLITTTKVMEMAIEIIRIIASRLGTVMTHSVSPISTLNDCTSTVRKYNLVKSRKHTTGILVVSERKHEFVGDL